MDTSTRNPATTPRRSQRIQRHRDPSPPLEESMNTTRGPRSLAKLKRSQRDLNKTAGAETETPAVNVARKSLPAQKSVVIEEKTVQKSDEVPEQAKRKRSVAKVPEINIIRPSLPSDQAEVPKNVEEEAPKASEEETTAEGSKDTKKKRGRKGKKSKSQLGSTSSTGSDDYVSAEDKSENSVPVEEVEAEEEDEPQEKKEEKVESPPEKVEEKLIDITPEKNDVKGSETPQEIRKVDEILDNNTKLGATFEASDILIPELVNEPQTKVEPQTTVVPAKVEEKPQPEPVTVAEEEKPDLNVTPNLMDESIVSVFDSPPPSSPPKDSTFSPVVDTSINDSRPHITELNTTPAAAVKTGKLRTSTPLVQKVLMGAGGGTPKRGAVAKNALPMSALAKTPKLTEKFGSEDIEEISKPNLLEKSILKSSRRRSKSVTDVDFSQRRVMFVSPQIMEIGTIDERMMQSFLEERETSMMVPALTPVAPSVAPPSAGPSGRRKRSLSTGTPVKSQEKPSRLKKMPDFKAIHQQQFDRMESIADHQARRNERAKKLVTPEVKKAKPTPENKPAQVSKIPVNSKIPITNVRKPLAVSNEITGKSRVLKRSQSSYEEEPAKKRLQTQAPSGSIPSTSTGVKRQIAVVSGLQRTKSETATKWTAPPTSMASFLGPSKPGTSKPAAKPLNKIEERREKNMSLYKGNQVQKSAADNRNKNANMLKGVRLNRRFELMMKNRKDQDEA